MFIQIDDNITEFGDLVSVELFGQLCDNINHLIDAMPVGTIIQILSGLPGCPTPDTNIWQECDGSMISHPLSPLRNHVTPDYKTLGRYTKCFINPGDIGNFAGSHTKNLSHFHTGYTDFNDEMVDNADTDDDFWTGLAHKHSISSDLGVYDFEPVHIKLKHYIKINNTNNVLADKFKDLEKDFGTSIAQALWVKAAENINSLDKSYPVGMVLYMFNSQDNLPAQPDPNFWQLLDGSVVNNPLSPLDGVTLPDVSNMFIRHPKISEAEFDTGGQNSVNLSHNHGGQTGSTSDRNDFQLDNGDENFEAGDHTHSISSDLGTVSTIPLYVELQCYVRII